jgi:hypothetical protein
VTEPESPALESITAWHPMLVALLEFYLPGGWQLLAEFLLNRMPLRVDIVILRRIGEQAARPRKLHSILDHLRPHTLIEHKGPTDDLEAEDALALLGYAAQYMRLVKVRDPADLCLMVVCDRIPRTFVEQIKRHEGTFEAVGGGLWRGKVSGFALHGVETRDACRQHPTERLLYAFSRSYLTDPEGILPLDPEEARVYDALYQQVEQFRKNRGAMAMKDYEAAKGSYEEVLEKLVERLPPEKRLRGLTPEQRLAGLAPEQRLAGLTIEQILGALTPEAREQFAKKLH